jgi:curved DNA-binding protein CbpA
MNALHKAYQALGLETGSSFEAVKHRYRQLAMIWHPDRMHNPNAKNAAEEELKKINQCYDLLKSHFAKQHQPGPDCTCQATAARKKENTCEQNSGPDKKPGSDHTNRDGQTNRAGQNSSSFEEEVRRRDEERRRKQDEAKRQENERRQQAEEAARQAAKYASCDPNEVREKSVSRSENHQDVKLRWRIAKAIAAANIALLASAWIGMAGRDCIGDIKQQWEQWNSHCTAHYP